MPALRNFNNLPTDRGEIWAQWTLCCSFLTRFSFIPGVIGGFVSRLWTIARLSLTPDSPMELKSKVHKLMKIRAVTDCGIWQAVRQKVMTYLVYRHGGFYDRH
ncbi:hypothetical protein I5192_04415 [Ruegeria sp. SCSIO 43209]|uniref:hypothetical protein n=1 Tax=Ruegeria sp. SCSIO 43209 TaxID=2793010 RepID=UPI00147A5B3A|nr:hypothetical protein [Ruegeria sp. SCSIO 43209]UAB89929.1 hypothetical protein I5192_04415 [Ruegeria sp. SCSIO 43209]